MKCRDGSFPPPPPLSSATGPPGSFIKPQNHFNNSPNGIPKLSLDIPDQTFIKHLSALDVLVISSGHWFTKPSIYILNNTIVGWQRWRPNQAHKLKANNVEAFGVAIETAVSAILNHPNFTGLTILRSYSPYHYEDGSCTGSVRPMDKAVKNEFVDAMYWKQVTGFKRALEKARKGPGKVRFMDVTRMFGYRGDGHPGPIRSGYSKSGRNGGRHTQDCVHWCMPGPVDTWNEIFMELVEREFD